MLLISKFTRWLLLIALIVIGIGSLIPSSGIPANASDKLLHLIGYAGLAFLIGTGFPNWPFWKVIGLASLYGILIEITQGLLPTGRSASSLDAAANFLGAVIGTLLSLITQRILRSVFKPDQ